MNNTECYAENVRTEQILAWLQKRLGPLRVVALPLAGLRVYRLASNGPDAYDLQLTALEQGVIGIWWLPSEPWSTQMAFAREVAQALGCRVWCSGEEMGLEPLNPYLWWCIDEAGEGPATWYGPDDAASA